LLLAQQASHTLSSRAKNSDSWIYCTWASALSHGTWIASNAFILFPIGKAFEDGFSWTGVMQAIGYVFWATLGNVVGQQLGRRAEGRDRLVKTVE
jgi:hypothetical protein